MPQNFIIDNGDCAKSIVKYCFNENIRLEYEMKTNDYYVFSNGEKHLCSSDELLQLKKNIFEALSDAIQKRIDYNKECGYSTEPHATVINHLNKVNFRGSVLNEVMELVSV